MSQSVNVNMVPGFFSPSLNMSQYDVGRTFVINLVDSNGSYSIPAGATVKLEGTKPSGFGFSLTGTVSGNAVSFTTTETVTAEAGIIPCEVSVTSSGTVLGSTNLNLYIEASPHPEGTIDGDAETIIPTLTLLVERVEAAADSVLNRQTVTNTLPAGSQASYSFDEDTNTQTFGIPQGEAGAGAAGVTANAYSSSSTYAVGDYVIHNSNLYRCTTSITTAEAFTAAHWTQVVLANDVSDLKDNIGKRLTVLDGKTVPIMELGAIAFSTTSIAFQSVNNATRTPSGGITVKVGDKVELLDKTNIKMKCAVLKNSDSTYTYTLYSSSDYVVNADGKLFIVLMYNSEAIVSNVAELSSQIRILNGSDSVIDDNSVHNMFANGVFSKDLLSVGDVTSYVSDQNSRPYRVSNNRKICFGADIRLTIESGYAFVLNEYINGTWTRKGGAYGWLGCADVKAGTIFSIVIRKVVEDTSSTADLDEFANALKITTIPESIINTNDKTHTSIMEQNVLPSDLFNNGEIFGSGIYDVDPINRRYRVTFYRPVTLGYDITLSCKSGYHYVLMEYLNNTWTRRGGVYGWQTSATIAKGTMFTISIAKTTEDTSSVANINTFVSNVVATTNASSIDQPVEVDAEKIEEFMAHFYESNVAESFAFFTDPHLMGTNGTFSEEIFNSYVDVLSHTVKRTSAQYVICGGDWLKSGDTKAQASEKLGFVDGQMRSIFPEKYYPIVGNHDFNYLGVDGEGNRLTQANWVSAEAMHNFWFHDHEHNYYSFKRGVSQNYVLDTRQDYDGTGAYDKAQLDWLAARLIEDDPAHAALFFHIYRLLGSESTIPTRILAVGEIISAFNSHSVCTLTSETHEYDKTYDFTNTTGHIDYSMVGHSHDDFIQTLGGVPIIATTNMQDGNVPTFDLVFADYTGGKLYMTRIGTGTSRSVSI